MEVGSRQRKTISKLPCDCRFRLREVCQKTDRLYSAAKSLFLTLSNTGKHRKLSLHNVFHRNKWSVINF